MADDLKAFIRQFILQTVERAGTEAVYRRPLVGFVSAQDSRFTELRESVEPTHMLPQELLPGARSVISFFLPFAPEVVRANARHRDAVAPEWARAYVETNALIARITAGLGRTLVKSGIRAAAEPATHNFDPVSLVSRWSHKSVAAMAGLGSFGLHHMLITDLGCAGRFGSLVTDADIEPSSIEFKERCAYFVDGRCTACVARCPVGALTRQGLDKKLCYSRLLENAKSFEALGQVDVCGKCAIGPCSFESAVP